MVDFLADLLRPIVTSYGVSEADLQTYLTQLIGYVYVILAALVVMIIVLIAADVTLSDDTIANSRDMIQSIGEEGMVLAKNEGLLPLAPDVKKLNVFGWDSTNPLFGGTGSGSSDASTAVGILQSFEDAGYETNKTLTDMYVSYREERPTLAMGT